MCPPDDRAPPASGLATPAQRPRRARRVLGAALLALGWGGLIVGPLGWFAWLAPPLALAANLLHAFLPVALLFAWLELRANRRAWAGLHLALGLSILACFLLPVLDADETLHPGQRFGLPRAEAAPLGPAPALGGAAGTRPLKVTFLNVGDAVARWPSVAALVDELDPDLFAVAEFNAPMAKGLLAAIGERYPHRALFPRGVPGRGLFSKHPILEADFSSAEGERPLLWCRLDIDGTALQICVVHLSILAPLLGPAEPSVRDTLRAGERLMDGWRTRREPGLLIGDFNSTATSTLHRRLVDLGLRDAYRQAGGGFGFSFPIALRYPSLKVPPCVRIDQAFINAGLIAKSARLGPDAGSDHLPLTLEFELLLPSAEPAPLR